jgi:hypothetical protein
MRTYFQQQISIKPVTTKESTEIIDAAKRYYRFARWELAKNELVSEMLTILDNPLNEKKEYEIFQAFSQEIDERYPKLQIIKMQYYSIHELPTSCFVLEKKTKRDKHDKSVSATFTEIEHEPDTLADVEPRTSPTRETD